jgi:hypothetical protein
VSDPTAVGLLRDADDSAFTVVHNRAATRGAVSDENAHPFEAFSEDGQWLMGVHNGTITGWESAIDAKHYAVDSAWALAQIAEYGTEAFKKIQGAYTFVWYGDREGETINMIRNYARPMFVAYVKDTTRMLFASEYMMMVWLAQRNELSLETDIIELEPGHIYSFNVDNPREFTKTKVDTYAVTPSRDVVLFESIEDLFSPKKKKESKPAPITHLTPAIKGEAVVEHPQHGKNGKYVTASEGRFAKQAQMFGKRVTFIQEHYDTATKELWGTVEFTPERGMTDLFAAVIRHVNKATYDTWKRASSLSGKVVGAMTDTTSEITLIVSRNVETDGLRDDLDDNDVDGALSRELSRLFQEGKYSNENHSKH